MTKKVTEEKIVADDGVSTIEAPVTGEGGEVKDRLADLKKEVDPEPEKLKDTTAIKEEKDDEEDEKKSGVVDQVKDDGDEDADEDEDEDEDDDKKEVKENTDFDAIMSIFEGTDLSNETKEKIKLVFEAAVETKVESIVEEKVAEISTNLKEEYATKYRLHEEKVDAEVAVFLENTSKEWLEENRIALEDEQKIAIAESLLQSVKEVFAEHNVEFDVETSAVVESLETELKESTEKLETRNTEIANLKKELSEMKRDLVFAEISEGLTTSQTDKLKKLASRIVFEDVDTYKSDVKTLKESFFPLVNTNKTVIAEETETIKQETPTQEKLAEDQTVNAILSAIKNHKN